MVPKVYEFGSFNAVCAQQTRFAWVGHTAPRQPHAAIKVASCCDFIFLPFKKVLAQRPALNACAVAVLRVTNVNEKMQSGPAQLEKVQIANLARDLKLIQKAKTPEPLPKLSLTLFVYIL